ncbi:unnamed protein product [Thlaspi arvense]|uniref:Uncharacterized protein n=1 Tax=Thlaspi arvense TaxID=13288 RepID=A0AAU9SRQ4_THLAR|nr:unnamed protein product [Thlaspi arvense]
MRAAEEALAAKKYEEPSFELSGKLAEESSRYRGITLLFSEPSEARKPTQRWRLYVFKDGEPLNGKWKRRNQMEKPIEPE